MNLYDMESCKTTLGTYRKVILEILEKYELGDSYVILSGLELVGIKNTSFWLQFVDYVRNVDGISKVEKYVHLMRQIPREELLSFLEKITYLPFDVAYLSFHDLLMKSFEIKSFNKKK